MWLARNLDLLAGGALALFAFALSRMAEPALAIVILSSALALLVIWLGDDRLEALWHAYSRLPEAPTTHRRRSPPSRSPRGPVRPARVDRRAPIPVARVVSR